MYTKEDFMRDYLPKPWHPFAFPWAKEYHDQELKKAAEKVMLSKGLEVSLIVEITGLPEADILKLQSTGSA